MDPSYKQILENAQAKKAGYKKFFDKLKQKAPKDLDQVCNQLNDEVFETIDCLQCANCCTTTGPLLLQKDVERAAKALKLRPADFTQQYLRTDEDGDTVFKSMPCPFIQGDKCCSIYGDRPNACREFPHTHQRDMLQKLKITFENTMICPAVALVAEGLRERYKV
ncbi:MAG TPA: YkgJ family cysteine cluster protein [Flavobacteriales bacterium]|nr:YkgJ family cysteine cluster protein [Flavobacteriales bacterium]